MSLKLVQVHKDERGEMYAVIFPDGRELLMLFTLAGYARGGHSHTNKEAVLMLSGRLRYDKLIGNKKVSFTVSEGDCVVHRSDEPHMGTAIEDCWLADWKIGSEAWKTIDYPPFRSRVKKINSARATRHSA